MILIPKRRDEFDAVQEIIRRDALRDGLEPRTRTDSGGTKDRKRQAAGKLGGKKSTIVRMKKLSPTKRKAIARKSRNR